MSNGVLFVTEGPIDVLRLRSAGFHNTCAVLGSDLGQHQERLIRSIGTKIVIPLFDQDEAGIKAREKLKKRFEGIDLIKVKEAELPDHKDPGDLTIDELKEIFDEYVS
jgi:DNA primase